MHPIFEVNTIRLKNRIYDLSTPLVMGILNVTPDSFSDGGRFQTQKDILQQTEKMLFEGASIIDVGGYSSRPSATDINTEEEKRRVLSAMEWILQEFPDCLLSVDTFRAEIAKEAIALGACLVNDISGGNLDAQMWSVIAEAKVPYVLMHLKGTPQTMTQMTDYLDMITEMLSYFEQKIALLRNLGVKDILLDVGFGFSKTISQNFYLMNHLEIFKQLGLPLFVGVSRKSMIYKTLQVVPSEAVNGTTILHTLALLKGASILRVHDVKEAVQTIRLWKSYSNYEKNYT